MLKIKASKAYRVGVKRYSKRQKKWVSERGNMRRLVEKGFQDRVAGEFQKFDRKSMITLTLLFGKEKAQQIKKRVFREKFARPRIITIEEREEAMARELRRREVLARRPRWKRWKR